MIGDSSLGSHLGDLLQCAILSATIWWTEEKDIPKERLPSGGPRNLPRKSDTILAIYLRIWNLVRRLWLRSDRQRDSTHDDKSAEHTHNPSGSNFDRRESVADSIPSVVGKYIRSSNGLMLIVSPTSLRIRLLKSRKGTYTNISISRYIPPLYFIANNLNTSALCAKCSKRRPYIWSGTTVLINVNSLTISSHHGPVGRFS